RLTLLGFDQLDSGGHRAALNLWLESVFSQEFEYVANATLGGELSRLIVELRAGDVMEHFNEFLVARDYLTRRGAVVAVDALFPQLLDGLSLPDLGIRLAKLHATADDLPDLRRRRDRIAALQQAGVTLVLCRTETEAIHRAGLEVGIRIFQGAIADRAVAGG
ncbi:MAG: hypothetical protein RLY86_2891, partial [Pseudomonadota bacterium]